MASSSRTLDVDAAWVNPTPEYADPLSMVNPSYKVLEKAAHKFREAYGKLAVQNEDTLGFPNNTVLLFEVTGVAATGWATQLSGRAKDTVKKIEEMYGKLENTFSLNISDTKGSGYGGMNANYFDCLSVDWLADILKFPKTEENWGYIATGSTEAIKAGTMFAQNWLGSEELVCFASQAAHYAAPKAFDSLKLEHRAVPTDDTGSMNLGVLKAWLEENKAEKKKAFVMPTCGTTVAGAHDNIQGIMSIHAEVYKNREDYYVHVDGAFAGLVAPFMGDKLEDEFKPFFVLTRM